MTGDRLVTTGEAARRANLDRRTIRKGVDLWLDKGDVPGAIPGFRTAGGHYRVDIDALLASGQASVAPVVRGGADLRSTLRKVS